jgi:type IV pilus assembly protein PilE
MASGAVTLSMSRSMLAKIACRSQRAAGFTLVEVMVAMVIIAILAAIAIPSYFQSIARGHRSEARATLTQAAQWMERWRTSATVTRIRRERDPPVLPVSAAVAASGKRRSHNITVVTPTPAQYTLSATPVAPGPMANDACGVLTLDQTGLRANTGPTNINICWAR